MRNTYRLIYWSEHEQHETELLTFERALELKQALK